MTKRDQQDVAYYWSASGTEVLGRAMGMLKHFQEVCVVGPIGSPETAGCWIAQGPVGDCYVVDNGGEFSVWAINDGQLPVGEVPTSSWGRPLNAATIAMRIACVLRGEAIDYDYELTDDDEAAMRAA